MAFYLNLILCVSLLTGVAEAQSHSDSQSTASLPTGSPAKVEEGTSDQYFDNNLLDTLHFRVPKADALLAIRFGTSLVDNSSWTWQNTNNTTNSYSWSDIYLDGKYGIRDDLYVGASDKGTLTTSAQQNSMGTTSYSNSGWSEPNLLMDYRFLGGLRNDHFASTELTFSPSMGSATSGIPGSNGNELRGDSLTALSLNGYKVVGRSEFSATLAAQYQSAGNYQYANGKNAQGWSSFLTYDVGANYRYHLNNKYFVGGNAFLYLPFQISRSSNTSTLQWTDTHSAYVVPDLLVGWKISENLVATADYVYSGIGSSFIELNS